MSTRKSAKVINKPLLALASCCLVVLLGCEQPAPSETEQHASQHAKITSLTTQVTYRDRSKLPSGSQLIVTLSDISKADTKASIVAQEILDITQAPPFTVELVFDKHVIERSDRYNLSARIINEDNVLYVSNKKHDPFTELQQTGPYEMVLTKADK